VALRVTTKEIARVCKVSVGTVDRALNNRAGINPGTRERIQAAAAQLGYHPHLLARGLVMGSTMTIGVVALTLRNPFFSELVEVIQQKARSAGYHVFLMLNEFDPQEEEASLERLRALSVDGIILAPVNRGTFFAAYLKRLSTPVVTISNQVSKDLPWVGIDEHAAVRDSVRFVMARGYEKVIFVTQSREAGKAPLLYVDEERIRGYRDAFREANWGFPPEIYSDTEIIQTIDRNHGIFGTRTCILCTCDTVALDVLNVLKGHSISVPGQVGLMGFDNLDGLKYVSPRLTTVSYPIEAMGALAFEILMEQIARRPVASRTLAHEIIEGESV
jgi:LacI family transcriptional regulator